MEIKPEGAGISIFETDLEVDFAPPVGYVEPVRPTPAPPATMASKLKIDLNSATPGSSRPGSALAGSAPGPSGDWESFKGRGETLNGRKTKGKGKSVRKIEGLAEGSRIYRTEFVIYLSVSFLASFVATAKPERLRQTTLTLMSRYQLPSMSHLASSSSVIIMCHTNRTRHRLVVVVRRHPLLFPSLLHSEVLATRSPEKRRAQRHPLQQKENRVQ